MKETASKRRVEESSARGAEEVGAGGKVRKIAKSNEYIETVLGPCVGERGSQKGLVAG